MQQRKPQESRALNAIRLGGDWFLAQANDRFLHYSYDAEARRWPETRQFARELASFWALTELARFLDDERYLRLAERGFAHFEPSLRADRRHGYLMVAPTDDEIKLSYNAFLILGLLGIEHEHKQRYLTALAQGIIVQQERSGRFRNFFHSERATGTEYYPGQALLALMTLFERSGAEQLVAPVTTAFPYYRGYWERHPSPAFVPWQTRAFCKLYHARPAAEIADYVFDMNDYLLRYMPAKPDPETPPSIATGVYVEGANEAYRLAREVGDDERAQRYADYIREGCEAVLGLQCPMAEQRLEDVPEPAVGGFFARPDDPVQRVDHNQHGVMALMGAQALGLID